MSDQELHELALAIASSTAAGISERRRRPLSVETKSSTTDLVTDLDRWAEHNIVSQIDEVRPGDGLVGEEGARRGSTTGVTWVIDPIDGTTNFVYGYPASAVSIAAVDADGAVAGAVAVIGAPEVFHACRGGGAFQGSDPIAASQPADLADALVATGFGYSGVQRRSQAEAMSRVIGEVRDIRRSGSAALDLCLTASGALDGFYEVGLNRWDIAAGELLVREAGGRMLLDEREGDRYAVVAASSSIFESLVALLEMARALDDAPQ